MFTDINVVSFPFDGVYDVPGDADELVPGAMSIYT